MGSVTVKGLPGAKARLRYRGKVDEVTLDAQGSYRAGGAIHGRTSTLAP